MKTAEVYLLECTPEFDKGYTYKLNFECETGMFVTVPFGKGNKSRTGIVLCVNELPDDEVKYKIKEVIEIDRHYPQLDSEALILAKWMQTRYICSFGDAVRSMLPPASAGRNVKYAMTAIETKTLQGLIESGAVKKEPQIKIIEALIKEEDAISVKDLMQIGNCSISVINTMVKRGYLSLIERKQEDASDDGPHEAYPEHELNREQQEVFTGISELLDRKNFCEVLMQGVTGSGKTEVYMHLISKVLAEGGNAIVLVPEISLTPQMSARFKGRFGNNVAVLHSRLGDRERRKQWEALKEGRVSIVVGARSAVFAPFLHVRLIIIDEEHENTYKSDNTPRFHAAEIARQRCLSSSGVVIYGSATPSVETFYKAISGKINYFKISNRANKCPMPGTVIVDMRQERSGSVLSDLLRFEIQLNLERKEQTILFVNRRGYSGSLQCMSCGKPIKCKACNIPMTYHASVDRAICHYCGNTLIKPKVCPRCGSQDLKKIGTGTQKLEEQLIQDFPGARVVRMDADTTSEKNGYEKVLNNFAGADILVGTQMIAKGHDFPKVTLVGIISADSLISMEDYRAEERGFQLMTQVAGRAGRQELEGRVIIQAYNVEDYAITAASRHNYDEFYGNEIKIRKTLNYPPFCHLACVSMWGEDDRAVYEACLKYRTEIFALLQNVPHVEILGPTRPFVPKINNKYKWRLILKAVDEAVLINLLSENSVPKLKGISYSLDVNPGFML